MHYPCLSGSAKQVLFRYHEPHCPHKAVRHDDAPTTASALVKPPTGSLADGEQPRWWLWRARRSRAQVHQVQRLLCAPEGVRSLGDGSTRFCQEVSVGGPLGHDADAVVSHAPMWGGAQGISIPCHCVLRLATSLATSGCAGLPLSPPKADKRPGQRRWGRGGSNSRRAD